MANVDNPEKTRRMAHAASAGRSVICKIFLLDGTTYDIDVDVSIIYVEFGKYRKKIIRGSYFYIPHLCKYKS